MAPFCEDQKSPEGRTQVNKIRILEALIIVSATIVGNAVVSTKLLGKDIERIEETDKIRHEQLNKDIGAINSRLRSVEQVIYIPRGGK
jgi:hypothetical protein